MAPPKIPTTAPPGGATTANDPYGLGQNGNLSILGVDSLFVSPLGLPANPTANDVMRYFEQYGSALGDAGRQRIAQIQFSLLQAGLYPDTFTPQYGVIRPEDFRAFRNVVQQAGQQRLPLDDYLSSLAQLGQTDGAVKQQLYETTTHVVRQSNPTDIAASVVDGWSKALGKDPSPSEKAFLVALQQQNERASQQRVFDAEDRARQQYIDAANAQNGASSGAGVPPIPPLGSNDGSGGYGIVQTAAKFLGTPYQFGAELPGKAFDCSGLTQYVMAQNGISIPRTSTAQSEGGQAVDLGQLQPGDLVFYSHGRLGKGTVDHVAIYAGNGQIIVAPHTGDVVKYEAIGHPVSARRYGTPTQAQSGGVENPAGFRQAQAHGQAVQQSIVQSGVAPGAAGANIAAGASGPLPLSQTITVTDPGNPAALAEAEARRRHPDEAGAHDVGGVVNRLMNLIAGGRAA